MIQELTLRNPGTFSVVGGFFSFMRSFFAWWYGDVPLILFAKLQRILVVINDITSFGVILKGYFRPWKNDYNIAGWLVGMVLKTCYLPIIASFFVVTISGFLLALLVQLSVLPVIIGLIVLNPFLKP
ncbi:hypothetical protein CO112_02340 [Candidatus Dojkabacteria bacterium CG_4_9_14_3_um_filter_150_Dojkabacteria_WS6_41_13]|uniref:Uncharacterized protein n=1 Tax=Candidatus Dojkabacteria bacterium CG_4_10_14_0_2_um_filter_Dojkabacteria_WS6_41_15 TaxID=2014249 RepID=A0A2M7W1T9_9BACT|nr:MAG: hypothetical protein COZ14_02035 [Candidatus Dojkabacteria bacterium CG_4_10_14_3_um_filter_Dojkabacteria_WS6_41_9]PJA13842.1 MAG: hypothetical protein COX64_02790 [Candidatus Dojkabacteria bacterium CG_4_10_14_0_2_um_filter_Dojkabacteria_WS6_41_15]PJB22814.1 MAG: hypothetical protein CO112_02340 [Candidatus Dojkabacteria bacterium CG_4_9_14_3_um_filter_150_Dojkabacteria_WS6_41_13]